MDASEAWKTVRSAVEHGLTYGAMYPPFDPEALADRFTRFDESVASGDEVRACWELLGQYHPAIFGSEVAEACIVAARHDLGQFVVTMESLEESRPFFELSFFPLWQADLNTCCDWISTARSRRTRAIGLASAIRKLSDRRDRTEELQATLERLTQAIASCAPDSWRLWWQLAAHAERIIPIGSWVNPGRAVWSRAGAEVKAAVSEIESQVDASAVWLRHCPPLRALLARIGEVGPAALRVPCAKAMLRDFERRLGGEAWDLPRLEHPMELAEYLPACGWAIAHDARFSQEDPWWKTAVAPFLPQAAPRWTASRGSSERAALVLLAVHYAVELLATDAPVLAERLADDAYAVAGRHLQKWLWEYSPPHSPQNVLALVLIESELVMRKHRPPRDRLLPVLRQVRDHRTLGNLILGLARSGVVDSATLAAAVALRADREAFESLLGRNVR